MVSKLNAKTVSLLSIKLFTMLSLLYGLQDIKKGKTLMSISLPE